MTYAHVCTDYEDGLKTFIRLPERFQTFADAAYALGDTLGVNYIEEIETGYMFPVNQEYIGGK